ncbi:MAG: GNAT family N-acetyltransferase [Candidatus Pacebacteria bacterium]|nr:GNAT family N-acetyltransferase [Candidatus Paceibacterota bacterium]
MDVKYKEISTINEFIDAIRLRADVFIIEQGFQPGWEPDEDDKISKHFIAVVDDKIVSTARLRETAKNEIKIERMVTKKEYREKGIGTGLVKFMVEEIKKLNPSRIWLQSQVQAQKFYEDVGFKSVSKPFDMWGVPHIDMDYVKEL